MRFSITALVLACVAATVGAAEPKPKASAAPPDFSGVWTVYRGTGQAGSTAIFGVWPRDAPLTKEAQEKVAEYRALVAPNGETPGGFCLGSGMPSSMLGSGGYPMEIIQRAEQITVIYEAHTEIRRIYMDGRKLPDDELLPTRNGFSSGRWEGDTLVVETIALKEAVDQTAAHSDEATLVERYTLGKDDKGQKVLTAELTLTDPKFYTRPVTVTKRWAAAQNGRMMIYECNEPAWEDHLEALRAQAKAQPATEEKKP